MGFEVQYGFGLGFGLFGIDVGQCQYLGDVGYVGVVDFGLCIVDVIVFFWQFQVVLVDVGDDVG